MQIDEATYKRLPPHLQALFVKRPNPAADEVLEAFAAFGESKSQQPRLQRCKGTNGNDYGKYNTARVAVYGHGDTGTAARFFYCAKASKAERGAGNTHPTVKPLELMRWCVRLVTPAGGSVLDPFAGSGTTLLAAEAEGREATGIEMDAGHCEIIRKRLADRETEKASPEDLGLFNGLV